MAFPSPGMAPLSPMGTKAWTGPGGTGVAGKGAPMGGGPGFLPGGCRMIFGPVAKVCNVATTMSQTVPTTVTLLVPVTIVDPIPSKYAPQTMYGSPIPIGITKGAKGDYGMQKPSDFGKGFPGSFWMGVSPAGAFSKGMPGAMGKGMPGAMGKGMPGAMGKGMPGKYGKGWGKG